MKIGLPKALLYYRYETLWRFFFEGLGCEVVISGSANKQILQEGVGLSVSECCLPLKVFLGHVASLTGRCDYILVPRFERFSTNEEFCVRFWGLTDIVRSTFPQARLLSYNLTAPSSEAAGFLHMGKDLGKSRAESLRAYHKAKEAQHAADSRAQEEQRRSLSGSGYKVLVAAQPYITHDPCMGGAVIRMLQGEGGIPILADRCDRAACQQQSKKLSTGLYWTMNKEVIGAIPLLWPHIDGVILLSAFPCGTDSLVNELVLRRTRNIPAASAQRASTELSAGIPIIQIVLDELEGEAGLKTRVECFMDILRERRCANAS